MGRVVLGATGEGADWRVLRDELVGRGWQVDLFDPTPRDDGLGPEAELPLLHGVDLAILLATSPSRTDETAANRRLVYLAGHLEQALGPKQVLFVRERGVSSLVSGTNVPELEYTPGRIAMLMPRITGRLAENSVPPTPRPLLGSWLQRVGFVDRRLPPEAWLVLALVLVLAAPLVGFLLYQLLRPATGLTSEAAETTVPVISSEAVGGEQPPAGPEPTNGDPVRSGAGADDGSVTGLPARCVIDTRRNVVLPEVVPCEGAGGVRVEGYRGPWHLEFHTLETDLGVIVEVFMETGPNVDGVTVTPAVVNDLEGFGSRGGVEELVVAFTADGQSLHITQRAGRGGNEARLVFALEAG